MGLNGRQKYGNGFNLFISLFQNFVSIALTFVVCSFKI
jgi:hypothetical protein